MVAPLNQKEVGYGKLNLQQEKNPWNHPKKKQVKNQQKAYKKKHILDCHPYRYTDPVIGKSVTNDTVAVAMFQLAAVSARLSVNEPLPPSDEIGR